MRALAKVARAHGYNVMMLTNCIIVSDADGARAVKNLDQLREWMGY